MNLIIPMAGRSSRFPNMRPKWMLTHPNGRFMVIEAISGLNLEDFDQIVFIYLEEHEQQYKFVKGFTEELEEVGLLGKSKLVALDQPTKDQPETVKQGILKGNITGPIFIKDTDNRFVTNVQPGNQICYYSLNESDLIKPRNKSYVIFDTNNSVINIVEKQVISPFFCVGGYGFADAQDFVYTLDNLGLDRERYISNIIYEMLLQKHNFVANAVTNYLDWGTVQDWDRFKRTYATLFVDMDGTIVRNSSSHFPPYVGESLPLDSNAQVIRELAESGKFQIVITTSRPWKYEKATRDQLATLGIKPDAVLMGLYHAKRIIINDYSNSNPYKSCDAINLKRNSEDLREMLRESLGIEYEEI